MPQEGAEGTPQAGPEPTPASGQEPQNEPKQEPKTFDESYVKQLRAEAAKYRTEAQEARQRIEAFEESQKSEVEKAQGRADKLEREAQEAKAKLLRYEVASEKEVPAKLVPLLTATTKEELEAQADLILENAKPSAPPPPEFDGGPREPAPANKPPEQAHNDFVSALFGAPTQ